MSRSRSRMTVTASPVAPEPHGLVPADETRPPTPLRSRRCWRIAAAIGDRQALPVQTTRMSREAIAAECTDAPPTTGRYHAAVALDITPRTPVGKLPEPDLGTELIPKDRYLSAEFMRREWERLWTRVWNLAGPTSDLEKVGDYFVFELGPESILVIRSEPDRIRAFYNVCQHRGRRIREPGCGHASELQCPYHLWTYGLDGTVSWVPDADDFPQGDPTGRLGLAEVRCETWNGWVFVNMDADA